MKTPFLVKRSIPTKIVHQAEQGRAFGWKLELERGELGGLGEAGTYYGVRTREHDWNLRLETAGAATFVPGAVDPNDICVEI